MDKEGREVAAVVQSVPAAVDGAAQGVGNAARASAIGLSNPTGSMLGDDGDEVCDWAGVPRPDWQPVVRSEVAHLTVDPSRLIAFIDERWTAAIGADTPPPIPELDPTIGFCAFKDADVATGIEKLVEAESFDTTPHVTLDFAAGSMRGSWHLPGAKAEVSISLQIGALTAVHQGVGSVALSDGEQDTASSAVEIGREGVKVGASQSTATTRGRGVVAPLLTDQLFGRIRAAVSLVFTRTFGDTLTVGGTVECGTGVIVRAASAPAPSTEMGA